MSRLDTIRFQAPSLPSLRDVEPFFAAAEQARWFSNGGPCVRRLERDCADYLGLDHPGVAVNNATSGLMVALRACLGEPGGRRRFVGVPSFTFVASVNAVVWAGFTPVFLDVDPEDWHVSESSLARLDQLGGELAGILQCSTFGSAPSAARRRGLADVAADLGVPVVVDSAAGFGSVDEDGRHLGDQGAAEVFSFHATKPFAIGEGGLVTSRSAAILESVAHLANFGFDRDREVRGPVGMNAKMPELSAAVGLAVLSTFDRTLAHRRSAAAWLRDELATSEVAFQQGSAASAHQFVPVALASPAARDRLLAAAEPAGIELRRYFDPPMHVLAPFAHLPGIGSLDVTEDLSRRIVGLPMANDIGGAALERIRDLVLATTRARTRPWTGQVSPVLPPALVATVA